VEVSDEQFQLLIDQALAKLPGEHAKNIQNVAILYDEVPTPEQRLKLKLRDNQTLLGLYEGVPLSQRQGQTSRLPDTITLFKAPLSRGISDLSGLENAIRHTLWHEIAHYYGLNHSQIDRLDSR
jgi:predicted Zn-dependent protease with MMP-like domain